MDEGTSEMNSNTKDRIKTISVIGIVVLLLISMLTLLSPSSADAAIYVGDSTIEGYEPQDIVNTDLNVNTDNPGEVAHGLENTVVKFIRVLMPFLMIACVCLIVFNAIRNLYYFRKKEKQVPMGELIKNMFVQFFFILFAFIIVELIVFVVTGGQTLLFATLLS